MVAPGRRTSRSAVAAKPRSPSIEASRVVHGWLSNATEPQRIGELIPQLLERYGLPADLRPASRIDEPRVEHESAETPVVRPIGLLPSPAHFECFAW